MARYEEQVMSEEGQMHSPGVTSMGSNQPYSSHKQVGWQG